VWRFMKRCTDCGGNYLNFDCGISRGCPLSPILGAYFLYELDMRIEELGLFYVRFMDDIVVLTPTTWKLKKAVRALNQVIEGLRLKVFFSSLLNCAERISRLHEQGEDSDRIGRYVRRWEQWVRSGLGACGWYHLTSAGRPPCHPLVERPTNVLIGAIFSQRTSHVCKAGTCPCMHHG